MQFDQLNCRKKLKMDEKPCRSLNLTGNSKLRNWQLEKGENIGRNVITRSALVLNSTRLIRPTSNNLNLLHNKLLNRNDLKVSVLTKNRNLNLSTYNKNRLRNSLLDSNLKKLQLKNKLLETKHTQQPTTINVLLIKHSNTTKLSDVVDQNELEEEFFEDILDGIAVQVPRYTFDDFSTRKKRIVPNDFLRKDIRLLSDPKTQTKISFVNAVSSSLISGPNLKLKDDQIRCIIVDYARETAQFDPEFVLKVAVYTRRELNIRSTANLLVAFAASNTECKPYLEKYFNCIIRLPSDWIEVAEQCQLFLTEEKKSRSLPAALRRAMVSKFGEFDEYQLAKYNKVKKVKKEVKTMTLRRQPRTYATAVRGDESKNDLKIVFSLKILIRSLHLSKPANFVMGILQRKYPQNLADFWSSGLPGMWDEERSGKRMKLATPETWETQLCLHGNRALIWEKLIDDKKLPFMAMLRNLRNLIIAKISEDHHRKIISILKDKELVMRSKQFPFRFLTAYNILCDLEKRSAEVKLMRSNQLGKTEKWLRKTRKLSTGTITDISKRYKTALNKSIDISTLNNIAPIKGHSIILCDCNADMESRCATTKSLHTQQKNRDIALLMALMCKHVCETSELHLFGSNGDTLVQLKKNTSILDNLNRITIELDENKGDARWNPLIPSSNPKEKGNEKFPARIFDNIFKDRTQVDTLIVFSNSEWDYDRALNFVKNYRISLNANLLYVFVELSSNTKRTIFNDSYTGHPNNILLSGFSDQLLRFIAERGSSRQLREINQIDVKYKLKCSRAVKKTNKNLLSTPYIAVPRWRTARVFISSTFRDMHGERDLLLRSVFPQLRARALDLCVDVHDIDLRWGITEQEAEDNKMVEICLSEAAECDVFVGLLGSRYGTIVNPEQIPESERFDWARAYPEGSSITELEFEIGALSRKDFAEERAVVCIRDNSFLDDVSSDYANDFLPENDEHRIKLEELKCRVRSANFQLIDNYACKWNGGVDNIAAVSGLEDLGELIVDRLWVALKFLYSDDIKLDDSIHENFAAQQSKCFTGRNNVLAQCMTAVNKKKDLIIVNGKSGNGKTALMSKLCVELMRNERNVVIPYFADAISGAETTDDVIAYFCRKLGSNIKSQVTDSCKTTVIHEMLHSAIEYSARFLLLLDGVEELAWIPNPVPPNVQFICTLTENSSLNTREMLRIPLPPLDLKERAEFVRAILLPHRKKLSESLLDNQLNKFITKHEAYSPLFLTFACHQMRLFWVFKEISENVRKMPNSVSGLLKEIMLQIERNNGSTLVSTAFKLLLMSKGGLLEEELYSILNLWMCSRKFNDPDLIEMCRLGNYKLLSRSRFAKFYGSVKVFLNLSSTLRNDALKISHREIVSVISKYCNPLENDLELNKCIAVYYLRQIDPTENENWLGRNPKAFEFVIARLISSGNLGKAVTLMTDLKFLFAKSNIGLCQSILEDFVLIQKEMNRSGSCESKLNDYQRFINRHRRSLNDVPSRIFQLAMNETNSIVSSDAKIHENIPPMIEWLNKSDQSDCCTAVFTLNQAVNCVSTYAGVAAAGIINGTIQLIDLTTSKVIRNIAAHCAEITCICFVDANLLICASESTLSSWNIDTGNRVVTFNGHERKVTAIGRGSGRTIICSVSWDRSIKIWDLKSGRNLSTCCEQYPISCCVMHPTRNDIAVGLWDGSVRIWNLISLKRTAILHGHKTSVSSISLSTCGKYLASSSLDGEIILRSSRHGFQLSKFRASDMRVNDIVFNGKDLWSVADDCAVKVWSSLLNDTREVSFPPPTASKVLYIATNPLNTAEVVVAYEDSTIIKLNSQSGDVLFTVRPILSRVCCVYFDKFIYVAYLSDDLQVLGSETGEIVKCFRTDRVNAITAICCFANDSPIFGYADGTVVVYWYESECRQFKAHDDVITCVVVHPDKHKLFATVSRDKSLKVWRVEEELVAVVDNCHADWINCCVWAPRNGDDFLVTSSNDNSVKLWSLTGSLLTLALVLGHTTGPAIFVDIWENCVICGASDGNIKMFTLKGSEVLSVDGQTTTHFVSCLNKNARTITNWYEEVMNVETEERTESDKSWPSGSLMSISNGTIKDSHLFGTNKVAILSGHSSSVQTAFVMADETVVTGSADGSLMKWNKGTNYQCQENRSEVCSIAWDKSGEDELMVSCCRDGLVSLWKNDKFSDKIIRISNFKLNSECVNGIHLIRKDKFLVTCDDGLICLCKIDDNFTVNLHETRELKRPICCSVYCDEEDILAVATIDGRVCINDVKSGKSRRVFEVSRSNWVIDMKFEDKKLVMLDTSGELKIVSVDADEKDSKLVNVAELELELDCNVIPHCFILESDFYFIGLSDGLLTRIEGDKKTDVRIHDGGVKFCVIDDTKRFLVTASNDRIVKVWNFDNSTVGSEVAQFECSAPICALSVPSINLIVCGDFHGKIYFLRLLQST